MKHLDFGDSGSLAHPSLHDAYVYRLDFEVKQLTLFCRAPGNECSRLELRGVAHMLANGLAEQNILLDVCLEVDNDRRNQILSRLLPGAEKRQQAYRDLVLQRLQEGSLMLLCFSPSYGGEMLVLCEEALYESC